MTININVAYSVWFLLSIEPKNKYINPINLQLRHYIAQFSHFCEISETLITTLEYLYNLKKTSWSLIMPTPFPFETLSTANPLPPQSDTSKVQPIRIRISIGNDYIRTFWHCQLRENIVKIAPL